MMVEFQVCNGVCKDAYCHSPMLFNLYIENVFRIALEGIDIEIKVNGKLIKDTLTILQLSRIIVEIYKT